MPLTVELRPIAPGDMDRLRRFHERLSPETVYGRYHGAHPVLNDRELRFLVGVDQHAHLASVATDGDDELLGVCRVIGSSEAPRTGEIAIVVADGAQGAGIGHDLVSRVLHDARRAGFETVQALILPTNTRARRLFESVAAQSGIPWRETVSPDVVEIELDLLPALASG